MKLTEGISKLKVLNVPQHSEIEKFIRANTKKLSDAHYINKDTKEKTTFDDPKRVWKPDEYEFPQFSLVYLHFPEYLREIDNKTRPNWGSAFYIEDENGQVRLHKEYWDTSG